MRPMRETAGYTWDYKNNEVTRFSLSYTTKTAGGEIELSWNVKSNPVPSPN